MNASKPAIIVISSHVVRGTVGNRAAAFALEVMGFDVWCVPTVTLPWHPGHGPSTRIAQTDEAFAILLQELTASPWLGDVGAILSGYLGNAEQAEQVAKLVRAVKSRNRDAQYTLDPVLGDNDSLYISEHQAEAIKHELLPLADLVTPNRFELGWLSDCSPIERQEGVLAAAATLNAPMVLATSSPAMMRGSTGNILVEGSKAQMAEHPALDGPPNGLGDLTAALMTGHLLNGLSPLDALQSTTASVFEVMSLSAQEGRDELALERCIGSLVKPQAQVQMRSLRTGK